MEIIGRVVKVLPMEQGVSSRGEWKKQTVVIEYMNGDYKQILALENMKDADKFAKLKVDKSYKFFFNVRSNEYNGRYFTSAYCYSVDHLGQQAPAPAPAPATQAAAPAPAPVPAKNEGDDDLPF